MAADVWLASRARVGFVPRAHSVQRRSLQCSTFHTYWGVEQDFQISFCWWPRPLVEDTALHLSLGIDVVVHLQDFSWW